MEERPILVFLYIPNETRPLRHGITADFGFLYIPNGMRPLSRGDTERNAAVKAWDNGRVWFLFMYTERNAAVKSWDNGRFWFSIYIPNETRPISHRDTKRNAAVKSWDNGRFWFSIYTERNAAVK